MGGITRFVRFVIGASLVAGGVMLIVPFARVVAETAAAARGPIGPATGSMVPSGMPAPQQLGTSAVGIGDPAGGTVPPAGCMIPEHALPPPVVTRGDYAPPPPPDRLPAVPASLGAEGPDMNGTYRSTLAVPPPPLLDLQAPPPAAGPVQPPPVEVAQPLWRGAATTLEPPATYVIRDGDDLTGIATRFYGHPAAAAAVWDANRDVIPDPGLLPIGTSLRMPPPWSVPGLPTAGGDGGRAIEPPHGMVGQRPPVPHAAEGAGWLAAAAGGSPAPPPSAPRGTVRLAPGETLETLAVRFYGDRSAASRIWEANRDRLRSPELAVAGMELRLP